MRFRLELFVQDLDASIRFYEDALGFVLERREMQYASLRRGDAVLGLGDVAALPETGEGPGFTQQRLASTVGRGAGVEIVLEVPDVDAAWAAVQRVGHTVAEPPGERPWGLRDFRVTDPDGYYVRVTTPGEEAPFSRVV